MRRFTLLMMFLVLFALQSNGQQKISKAQTPLTLNEENQRFKQEVGLVRCVSTESEELLHEQYSNRATEEEFEAWLAPKVQEVKNRLKAAANQKGMNTNVVVTIPVVVHVIHDGDAIGANENISYERVLSQITVLNEDYRRMTGTPGFNNNAVGADVEVEFCLAQTAPDGTETDGVDRVFYSGTTWSRNNIQNIMKPQTQWDPTQYFNIWVCEFGGDLNQVLGYAQFPSQSGLNGLDEVGGQAQTDGVTVNWRCFGSADYVQGETFYNAYNKGRTLTHEVGHALGLRHIWGDNNSCIVNPSDSFQDYCPDTPAAAQSNATCSGNIDTCPDSPGLDMTENYMDYTNDVCMNVFTQDQKARILAVLENSPRRVELISSDACGIPDPEFNLDGSLELQSTPNFACNTFDNISLNLTNYGSTDIETVTFSYSINGGGASTYQWSGLLSYLNTEVIELPSITGSGTGEQELTIEITAINGATDENLENNTVSFSAFFNQFSSGTNVSLELQPDYAGSQTTWEITDAGGNVVYSGGPYENSFSHPAFGYLEVDMDTQAFSSLTDGCYTFTIYDSGEDGLCNISQDEGPGAVGYFTLIANDTEFYTGCEFESEQSVSFYIGTMATEKFGLDNISLFPNPASNVLNINIGNNELPNHYTIYNTLGQRVLESDINTENDLRINTSSIATGVYIVKITSGTQSTAMQFIKK